MLLVLFVFDVEGDCALKSDSPRLRVPIKSIEVYLLPSIKNEDDFLPRRAGADYKNVQEKYYEFTQLNAWY